MKTTPKIIIPTCIKKNRFRFIIDNSFMSYEVGEIERVYFFLSQVHISIMELWFFGYKQSYLFDV